MEYAPGLRLERRMDHGGNLSLGIDYSRISSTSNTQTLSPQYSANLAVGLAQPLLRDFGSDVGTTRLRVAEKGAEIAEQTLYQRVAELIRQVEETYVSYAFLLSDIEGKRRSLDIARGFEEQSQELFQAGRVAQVSVLQARSAVAEREELVLAAEAEAARFEDRLKNLLWLDLATTELEPRPLPERVALGLDPAASFQLALARRPEILALRREVEQREIEVRFADNQLRPRLDLAAEYSLAGLAGKPNPTCLDPTSVFCTPVGDSVAGSIFAGQTGATDAVSTLFRSSPFDTWSVGLTFELPVGNRTANGLRSEATLRLLEARTELATLEDQVQEEIRNAIRETQTADARIGTSGQTVTYLEDQLEGMESQLEAGFVSAYEVLEVLDALDQARTRQLRAVMDFNIGLSRVRFAEAASLERYGVEVVALPRYEFAPPILR
jgi:outer membrane protein TolC